MAKLKLPDATQDGIKVDSIINELVQQYEEYVADLHSTIRNSLSYCETEVAHRKKISELRHSIWNKLRKFGINTQEV